LHQAIQRCFNPNNPKYPRYGGRLKPAMDDRYRYGPDGKTGIGIEALVSDIGSCPKGYTLGRINNDIGYCVGNLEWQTRKQQGQDTGLTHHIPLPDGRLVTLKQMSQELGLSDRKIQQTVDCARRSILCGATAAAEQGTKVGIDLVFRMLLAGILKTPDDHQAPVRAVLRLLPRAERADRYAGR
jgi:hypothetical protein